MAAEDSTTPLRRTAAAFESERTALRNQKYFLRLLLAPEGAAPADHVVVFSHIPKTGGSTLQQVVLDNYPDAEQLRVVVGAESVHKELKQWHREFVASMTADERNRIVVLAGHGAGYMVEPLGRPVRMITMIRDPVDRALSWIYYSRTAAAKAVSEGASIREIYERAKKPEFFNGQARFLLGPEVDTTRLPRSKGPPPDADVWRSRLFELLADRYTIGLQEAYQPSLERFGEVLGWTSTTVRRSKKVNPRRPRDLELDEETYDFIRDMNWLDQELYEHCRQTYPEASDARGYVVKRAESSSATIAVPPDLEATQRRVEEQAAALSRVREETEAERRELRQRVKKLESEKRTEGLKARIKTLERRVAELEQMLEPQQHA